MGQSYTNTGFLRSVSLWERTTFKGGNTKYFPISGIEFWYARDLQGVLEYAVGINSSRVIARATVACETSGHAIEDHFVLCGKNGSSRFRSGLGDCQHTNGQEQGYKNA